ncbi:MAG: signal recognition particle-docking protein FtsY [Gammaproteobacteria bacterium]|nr:signal recognition particle-docking protein FtsY [Gammaproteobacteria bacterium]
MFKRLREGIARTRDGLLNRISKLFGRGEPLDTASIETLESALLLADTGVQVTAQILDAVKKRARDNTAVLEIVRDEMTKVLTPVTKPLVVPAQCDGPFVILVVGVNGAGKTTTIAKIGGSLQAAGLQVMFAAGDTFRAAAVAQLKTWGERLNIPVIAQIQGADPASVIFDAYAAATARGIQVLIVDTAGRLHTQDGLMAELVKVRRVLGKQNPAAPHETLLVLDATMGQNALQQARMFHRAVNLDSVVLTKLDGTAKGGIVFAIAQELALPIRYIGVGEHFDDLQVFSATNFVAALLGSEAPNL